MGHEVYCTVRDPERLSVTPQIKEKLHLITLDFLVLPKENPLPKDIDVAYYLIHSMSSDIGDFSQMEADCAKNFVNLLKQLMHNRLFI